MNDERCFSGKSLWGDDFDEQQRAAWFKDEQDAFFELYASNPEYEYEYDAVNSINGFRFLPPGRQFKKALGLGSAYGDEMRPIAERVFSAVVVESSDHYEAQSDAPFPLEWRKAMPSGDLPLQDSEVDLTVCFGVLHHIPNVSHVIDEIGRVTEAGGYALIREPIVSMGDWRQVRPGLTPRERGIPRVLLMEWVKSAGFEIVKERLCFFPGTKVIARGLRRDPFRDPTMVRLDAALSRLTLVNYRYHPRALWQKARPTSSFLTLRRC